MEILKRRKRKKQKDLKFEREYEFIPGALYIGEGVNLRNPREGKRVREVDIYKSPDMRSTHLICLGRTRWGKTRFIERSIVDDIESGFSIFHLDPKMDYDNLEALLDAIIRCERADEFLPFLPYYSEVSLRINVFYQQIPDAISDIIKSMSPKSKDQFFAEVAGELGKAVSISEYLKGAREIRFVDIFRYTSVEEIDSLYNDILEANDSGYVEIAGKKYPKSQLKADGLMSLNKIRQKDKAFWSKVNSTLELVLSQMSTGDVGEAFGRAKGNPLLDKMVNGESFIFTAMLGSLFIGKDPAYRMSRMINAMHEKAYGRVYVKFQKLNPPVSEYWDEGSVVIYEGAEEKINKVGGAGGYIQIFTQSLSDFKMNVGPDGTKVFLDNADIMLMSVLDQETARYFAEMSGKIVRNKPMWTRDEGVIAVPQEEHLIKSDYFMRMPKGAFHAFIEGSWYRGYSPMLTDRRRIIIEPLPYPDDRIVKHFADKYNLDVAEASRIIKQEDLARDYDWIMKEGLADLWIDLKEFPYYKNYVQNYKGDEGDEVLRIISGFKSEKEEELKSFEIKGREEEIASLIGLKQGKLEKAILDENDKKLYIHYFTFVNLYSEADAKELDRKGYSKEINGYKYIFRPLTDEEYQSLKQRKEALSQGG